jgi:Pin2-interacting protein X1
MHYISISSADSFKKIMAAAIEAQKQQRYQGVQKESAGYKLMAAMGWKEGEGLGASKQGIKEHIRVKKNYENWGVGAVTAADRAKEWTAGMADFHRVLSTLSEITSQHAGKKPGEEESEDEGAATTTDEESDASDGELKKKKKSSKKSLTSKSEKKKKRKEEKKLKKKKNKKNSSSSSSEDDSEDDDEEKIAPAKRPKLATHLGRFKKRESAKMVSKYSSHDLAAILGEDPFAAAAAAVSAAAAAGGEQSSGGYESDSESDSDVEGADEKRKKKRSAAASKRRKVITIQEHEDAQRDAEKKENEKKQDVYKNNDEDEEDSTEYWWSSYFVRRGKMGSLRRTAINRARGFSEQDQTDLFTKAHDGATLGRVGLGRSSLPKKVAGARWIGKKKKLGSDSEDSESEGEQERREEKEAAALEKKEAEEEEARGVVVVLPGGGGGAVEKGKKEAGDKKIKWKKVVSDVLSRENSGSMKLKAVIKAVMEAEGLSKSRKTEASEAITGVVEGSSKFKLDGKNVKLA